MAGTSAIGAPDRERFQRHLEHGGELLRTDRVQEARAEFERALAIDPESSKALGLAGLACFRLSAFADALDIYRTLVNRHPDDASYRLNLGLVHLKLGTPELAIEELARTRDLDPSMSRAVSYLGLAYARSGRYLEAYEAFLHVKQNELAAEMEQYLDEAQIAAARRRVAPDTDAVIDLSDDADAIEEVTVDDADAEATADAEASAAADVVGAVQATAVEATQVIGTNGARAPAKRERRPSSETGIPPANEFDGAEARDSNDDGVPVEGRRRAITQAVEIAEPTGVADADVARTVAGHEPPQTLSQFATGRLIRPDDGDHPFEISAGGVLIVRVRGTVMSRTEGVIVSGGELSYEPATRRVRGHKVDEPFSGERPLFIVSGDGHLVASPIGHHFAAVRLDDDVLYVREDLVFAFEDRLRWENGFVPGSDARISVVQFRGDGCVAIRTRRPSLAVKLIPERVLYIDADALAGWVGRVVPRVVAPAAGGEASALFVECSGEGVVLLEDEGSRQDSEES